MKKNLITMVAALMSSVMVLAQKNVQKFEFEEIKEDLIQSKYTLKNDTLIPVGIDEEASLIGKITKRKTIIIVSFNEYISITGEDEEGNVLFSFEDIEIINYAIDNSDLETTEVAFDIYTKEDILLGTIWINPYQMTIWHSPEDSHEFMDRFRQCTLSFPNEDNQKKDNRNTNAYESFKKSIKRYHGKTRLKEIN